jgi:elongation factor Ts
MSISAQDVKKLREMTGVGMMDCKKALAECEGDFAKAVEHLRKKGLSKAADKAGRETKEGVVHAYIHPGARVGVLLEVNCETDFVAKTDDFQQLVHDVAMHVAAASPRWVRREDVEADTVTKESEIYAEQMRNEGKPEKVIEKIVQGKLEKFYQDHCLLEQPFVKDTDKTVQQLVQETVAKLGENIQVARFSRFSVGE